MKMRDLMTAKPFCCLPQTKLGAVAELMRDCDCGAIPVIDADHAPVGMITDRDIVTRVLARGLDARELAAHECMTAPAITISDDSELDECLGLLERSRVRRVIVVDAKGHCAGIVAQADVAEHASKRETGELLREVSNPSRSDDRPGANAATSR